MSADKALAGLLGQLKTMLEDALTIERQRDELHRYIERLRPVVEAARSLRDACHSTSAERVGAAREAVCAAVDALDGEAT